MATLQDITGQLLENRALGEIEGTFKQQDIIDIWTDLRKLIAQCYVGSEGSTKRIDNANMLLLRIRTGLANAISQVMDISLDEAYEKADEFIAKLPDVLALLDLDIQAMLDGDPAAENKSITVLAYPGYLAIQTYRLAHELVLMGIPMIPRIMSEHAHSLTGIDINPGATIGKSFFIDHGTGIVIGETCVIGDNVKIYQGVTLGALSTRKGRQLVGVRRHPTIENNVTIYAGAVILGGDTVIGKYSTIGGGTFIFKSIPPYSKVSMQMPQMRIEQDLRAREGDSLFEIPE